MTNSDARNWLGSAQKDSSKTTFSHPPRYDELLNWAGRSGVSSIFQAVAVTFGFTENLTILGDLNQEFGHPESKVILAQWDGNPVIAQLAELDAAFQNSHNIRSRHPPLPISGGVQKIGKTLRELEANTSQTHYLLYLLVTPLANAENSNQYADRRALRLWLITQGLIRTVRHQSPNCAFVSRSSLYVTKGPHDKNWVTIDALLDRTQQLLGRNPASFRFFSYAIGRAAQELRESFSDQSSKKFFNAIVATAQGDCDPIRVATPYPDRALEFGDLVVDQKPVLRFGEGEFKSQVFQLPVPQEQLDTDHDDQVLLFDVSPEETPERQKLTGASIQVQSAELSHFLPWSWDRALPPEITALEQWLDTELVSHDQNQQFGAAIVWLAAHLSRSLPFVLEFAITDDAQDEWAVSQDFSLLHRRPPRRQNAWYPGAEQLEFIQPFVEEYEFALPPIIQTALHRIYRDVGGVPETLGDLWNATITGSPEVWFNQQAKDSFPRLTSGKLANIRPQKSFLQTNDHVLARLISAHARSALPAPCGYANWTISQVEEGIGLKPQRDAAIEDKRTTTLLGSLLNPLESLIDGQIERAGMLLERERSTDLVRYHNCLVQYVLTALTAATGSRYLSDPFESALHFCASPPAVYINDKSDGHLHNGRLVPLASGALAIFQAYTSHLRHLAGAIESVRPEMAERLRALPDGGSDSMPLFFLFDSQLKWHTVSEKQDVPGGPVFEWPLPPNLFRHRYAQSLLKAGVDPEVVEGWMGHAERGVATYGDASARCWVEDYARYKGAVEDCFDRLPFAVPDTSGSLPSLQVSSETPGAYREPTLFGQRRRARERNRVFKRSVQIARRDIDLFLNGRSIETLEPSALDDMIHLMLFREDGMPHPQAATRFRVLEKKLSYLSGHQKLRIRTRMARIESERSLVTERCPQALEKMPELQRSVTRLQRGILKGQISKKEALVLAAVMLVINKRVTYWRLIEDVLQGQNFRLVQHKKQVFLEYRENLDPDDWYGPVQRHEIDYKTGSLLSHGLTLKTRSDLDQPVPSQRLTPILEMLPGCQSSTAQHKPVSVRFSLKTLADYVDQANVVELPGIVAGALSGRIPATSAAMPDYLRLREGKIYEFPRVDTANPAALSTQPITTPAWPDKAEIDNKLYASAKAFFTDLRDILGAYSSARWSEVATRVERFCASRSSMASPTVILLGYWVADRIRMGKGKTQSRHKPYATGTPYRYLSALSPAFSGLAYNVDLMELDEESVTDLCSEMLTLKSEGDGNLEYFGGRLKEFFSWASERGIAEPDWDALDFGDDGRSVRPGVFSEQEYLLCLEQILTRDCDHPDDPKLIAFVLMVCYRFGLRAQEAIQLRRNDWCEATGQIWFLVRNNRIRQIKTTYSRRAIPLLFELQAVEKQVINDVFVRYDAVASEGGNAPILCDFINREVVLTPLSKQMPDVINRALKAVTGNPTMSMHQARHSLYNRLSSALMNVDAPLAQSMRHNLEPDDIRQKILGNNVSPTRRTSMALARVMGHSAPPTGLRSYNRTALEWADALIPVTSQRVHRLPNAFHTKNCATRKLLTQSQSHTPLMPTSSLTPENTVRALRLLSRGYSTERIENSLNLEPGSVWSLSQLISSVSGKMRFKMNHVSAEGEERFVWVNGSSHPNLLLRKINEQAWGRLLEQAKHLPEKLQFDDGEALPPIENATDSVGLNGQLLMPQSQHCRLVKLTVDLFQVPVNQYQVVASKNRSEIEGMLRQYFVDSFAPGLKERLDKCWVLRDQKIYRDYNFGGLILQRASTGCIRNRLELVLAMAVTASLYCDEGPSQAVNFTLLEMDNRKSSD